MSLIFETAVGEDLDLGTGTVTKTNPGGGTLSGTQVSISTLGIGGAAGAATTATWVPGDILALQSASTTVTVPGAAVGDFVLISHTQLGTNAVILRGHVQAANTVRVVLSNPTNSTVTIPSGTLSVLVLRPR